ncbi:MAG: DUF6869 domain-containing protein [Methylocella sp.]
MGYRADALTRLIVLTMDTSNEEIAAAWIKYSLRLVEEQGELNPNFWASDALYGCVRDDPERAWQVIDKMAKLDSSERVLAKVAAGPLEDLLVYHGEQFIDRVEQAAQIDPTFKKMLGAVWQNEIPREIWARVKAVAGPTF